MEEFQEADVLWPDQYHHRDDHGHGYGHHHQQQRRVSSRQQPHVAVDDAARSAPVGIPVTRSITSSTTTGPGPASWTRRYCSDDGAGSFVPPHEIASRRRCSEEERAASSVCVGHGRKLKGRDLRSVRTAVLRMTGFLES